MDSRQIDAALQKVKDRVSRAFPNLPPAQGAREDRLRQEKIDRLLREASAATQQQRWEQARQAYVDSFYLHQSDETRQLCAQNLYQLLTAMGERASEHADVKTAENIHKTLKQLTVK